MKVLKIILNSWVFWFFLVAICFLIFNSCKAPRVITESPIPVVDTCDTIYGGNIKTVVFFDNIKTFKTTFIITDSITLSIEGHQEVPLNVKCYAFIYNGDRRQAYFIWDGEEKKHKILSN